MADPLYSQVTDTLRTRIIEGFDRVIVDGISLHSVVGRRIFETWHITRNLLERFEDRLGFVERDPQVTRALGELLPDAFGPDDLDSRRSP